MHGDSLITDATQLVLELAIIIIASWVSKNISIKIKIPPVVGHIIMGIILGPFILGSIPITELFPHGLFPRIDATIPVSPYLYSFSAIASILLLFMSGLETDSNLFIRYAITGSIVGVGGLIVSFASGYALSVFMFDFHLIHPIHLFMGTIATATSVGITTSVLSDQHKINSPEGVTILSAAVLDDVLGIIVLAIILGISDSLLNHSELSPQLLKEVGLTSIKAIGLWLGCTILGIAFAKQIGSGMKKIFKDTTSIAVISIGFALLLGGIFELAGLSMVIGAYIMGLSLSNTDLSYVIQEKIHPITTMFTPIFFVVTGMLINLQEILQWHTFFLGLAFAFVAIFAKIIGCGIPSLFLKFNMLGALRIGVGMAPRGEIALIVAGIGISFGIIDDKTFGVILIMIFVSALLAPYFLNMLLKNDKAGIIQTDTVETKVNTTIDFKHETLKRLILVDFLQLLEEEQFFINKIIKDGVVIFHIRKDTMFITLETDDDKYRTKLAFHTDKESISFIKTALYEATANLAESSQTLKHSLDTKKLMSSETSSHEQVKLDSFMSTALIETNLQSTEKIAVIHELIDLLDQENLLYDKNAFTQEILEREETFSTGMQEGIAIPHAKTNQAKKTSIAIGIKKEGLDFNSLDGLPSTIFILIATTKDTPHLSILTSISSRLNNKAFREQLLMTNKRKTIYDLFTASSSDKKKNKS